MAAGTADAAEFKASAKISPDFDGLIYGTFTIPTTGEETANDRINLITLPEGAFIASIWLYENEALDSHATPTLDADLVLVQGVASPADAGTETILYNAGTRFRAASTTIVQTLVAMQLTAKGYNGKAYIRWLVNTGSATAAAGTIKIGVQLAKNAG